MNGSARKRLAIGLIVLVLICFGLYLYLNNSRTVIAATSAQLETKTYNVGTTFSGQITSQFVHEGDEVKANEKMFYVRSAELAAQKANPNFEDGTLDIPLTKSGEIIISASKPGTIKTINFSQGSFVPTSATLAVIAEPKDLRVIAKVKLDPGQYAAIDNNSRLIVTLPTAQVVTTKIANINVENEQNQVLIEITGKLDGRYDSRKLIDGAPVSASLEITKPLWQKWLNGIKGIF